MSRSPQDKWIGAPLGGRFAVILHVRIRAGGVR
jgi:hypothetical protein